MTRSSEEPAAGDQPGLYLAPTEVVAEQRHQILDNPNQWPGSGAMPSPSTTFIARVATDKALMSAISTMYAESLDHHPDPQAQGWREQASMLLNWYGRAMVIEALMEAVPGLSMRAAITLADVAEREESGVRHGVVV